jgi:inosose dehydratase
MRLTRRQALMVGGVAAGFTCSGWPSPTKAEQEHAAEHIATNTYPWGTFASRDKQPFAQHADELLTNIAEAGIQGYEPIIVDPAECSVLKENLKRHGLEMRSLYVNSQLHDKATAEKSIADVLAIAEAARPLGTTIIVTNPSPIQWGGTQDKSDAQLDFQVKSLDELGHKLRTRGLTLAYHNHDAELRRNGREFHRMLSETDPANVKFCLDAHWVYRGSGNSQPAVFDALSRYWPRVVELHLRQSHNGVWDEVFTMDGDIDYGRIFEFLRKKHIQPHLVLEQSVETGSPHDLTAVEGHRQSGRNLRSYLRRG